MKNVITISNAVMYHGTSRVDFMSWLQIPDTKYVWFSLDERQSEYLPFSDGCGRGRYEKYTVIPAVYKFQSKRPLNLLNLRVENDKCILANTNDPIPSQYIEDYDIAIMRMIDELGLCIDGYVCFNDGPEIALIIDDISSIVNDNVEIKLFNVVETLQQTFNDCNIREDYLKDKDRYTIADSKTDLFYANKPVNYIELPIVYTPYTLATHDIKGQIRDIASHL